MERKRHSDTKAGYQRIISEYKSRRNKIRQEFIVDGIAIWNKEQGKVEYGKRVKKINHRIKICKDAIRRIEVIEEKLIKSDNLVYEYTGVKIRNNVSQTKIAKDARKIFYRHVLELGIDSRRICDYLHIKDIHTPTNSRMAFIRSMSSNKANKELWYRWKQFIKTQNENNE